MRLQLLFTALTFIALLTFIATLPGCTNDSSNFGSAANGSAPNVSETSPANGVNQVSRTTTVTASFDKDILGTSVGTESFVLESASGPIAGSVEFDGFSNTASFTPNGPLPMLSPVSATATTDITDLSGNPLPQDYTWTFTTMDGQWGTATALESSGGDVSVPQAAFDSSGNALVVWAQHDGTYTSIFANRYTAMSDSWSGAVLLETSHGDASAPEVAIDTEGNALVVWQQHDGTYSSIYANRFIPDNGNWTGATLLETNSGDAANPQVAYDANGSALVVWSQHDGVYISIYANRLPAGGSWTGAVEIETSAGDAANPQLSIDGQGNALAVWQQHDGAFVSIYGNRYTASGGWEGPSLLEASTGNAALPGVAFDAYGNALAVWQQHDGTNVSIYANRYTAAANTWDDPILLETSDLIASSPRVAVATHGLAVWTQHDGTYNNVYVSRYHYHQGAWGSAALLETNNGNAESPAVNFDANGNALTVWQQQSDASYNIFANRYPADGNWTGAGLLENESGNADSPQVAFAPNGNALVVWRQHDGANFSLFANRLE